MAAAGKKTWTKKVRPLIDLGGHLGVSLSDGSIALIDHADRAVAEGWNWAASHHRNGIYAKRNPGKIELGSAILGQKADHIDGNPLDNRRSNLRPCTAQQNAMNRKIAANNTSGFKGVYFRADRGTWLASIRHNGRLRKLGTFMTPEDAAQAYDEAARLLFGEFAAVNFPDEGERGAREVAA